MHQRIKFEAVQKWTSDFAQNGPELIPLIRVSNRSKTSNFRIFGKNGQPGLNTHSLPDRKPENSNCLNYFRWIRIGAMNDCSIHLQLNLVSPAFLIM